MWWGPPARGEGFDGTENCWSIAHSIESDCKKIIFILDWLHIAMKVKNIAIAEEYVESYSKIKWHSWHSKPVKALTKLEQLAILIKDISIVSHLNKLTTYINNKNGLLIIFSGSEKH